MDKLNDTVLLTDKIHNETYLKKTKIWEKVSLTKKKGVAKTMMPLEHLIYSGRRDVRPYC